MIEMILLVFITMIIIWFYCIYEFSTLLTGDIVLEECSEEDMYSDILDRQKSRR